MEAEFEFPPDIENESGVTLIPGIQAQSKQVLVCESYLYVAR